jgi:uncharacterized protein
MSDDQTQAAVPRPWGVVMTIVWTVVMMVVAVVASAVAMALWLPDMLVTREFAEDTRSTGIMFIVMVLAEIVVLAIAARLAGWRIADYLGLVMPSRQEAVTATAVVVMVGVGLDLLTLLLGRDVVTPFQIDLYRNANTDGAFVVMLIMLVVAAPVGEELLFRGFLYRGWAQSPRAVLPTIVIISAIWAVIHTQYDWYGVSQIFILGLAFGWIRWQSGSTLLTIALHGLVNLWATIQTVIKLEWLTS